MAQKFFRGIAACVISMNVETTRVLHILYHFGLLFYIPLPLLRALVITLGPLGKIQDNPFRDQLMMNNYLIPSATLMYF